jgi:AcrR family transcriptional regulator
MVSLRYSDVTVAAALPVRSPGRPRDPRRDAAILESAIELIAEVGYERMTIDALAQRAGVGRPTIYRRWPGGKPDVVAAALLAQRDRFPPLPDTGSLRGDLIELVRRLVGHVRCRAHLATGLLAQVRESEELARLFREHILSTRQEWMMAPVERAIARGELPAEPRVSPLFVDVAPGLVFARFQFELAPLDDAFVAALVDEILLPILRGTHGHGRT